MSLADKAKSRVVTPHRRPNPIDVWLATLPEEERQAGLSILNDPRAWPQRLVLDAFADEGLLISRERIGEWRRAHNVVS